MNRHSVALAVACVDKKLMNSFSSNTLFAEFLKLIYLQKSGDMFTATQISFPAHMFGVTNI